MLTMFLNRYPMAGTGVLLPMSAANNWVATVLICGGSTSSDTVASTQLNAQDPASKQCARLEISNPGLAAGWQVEEMPEARIMPDAVGLISLPFSLILTVRSR